MALEKDWFRGKSPADIITQVGVTTLAVISQWDERELRRVGWLDNPIIETLYTLTSAGVWVAKTDAYGGDATINASLHNALKMQNGSRIISPSTTQNGSYADYLNKKIGTAGRTFTSNAGGGFDLDVNLASAVAGYYTVIRFGKIRASQNVAAGVLIIHDSAGNLISTLGLGALVAYTPSTTLEGVTVFIAALTDNRGIVLDTTSHDLGNATSFVLDYEYWYET